MPSSLLTKSAALLACLAVMAAPAFSAPSWRCADGQPCPLTKPAPKAAPVAHHPCCPPTPCDEAPPPLPDPAHCVLEAATPAVLLEQRTTLDVSSLHVLALAPLPPAAIPPPAFAWAVVTADVAPPPSLAPEQGQSPRAPPACR